LIDLNQNIWILLHRVEGPVNLGSICRVMANFGFEKLGLTGPLSGQEEEVKKYALHAEPIMQKALKVDLLSELVSDCHIVVGFTPRSPWDDHKSIPYEHFPERVMKMVQQGKRVGLLFGNEAHGLSNQELTRCDYRVSIPTSLAYSSMNLSHAVTAALLPLRTDACQSRPEKTLSSVITASQKDILVRKMLKFMDTMDYLHSNGSSVTRKEMEAIWMGRDWTEREWELLLGLFNKGTTRYQALSTGPAKSSSAVTDSSRQDS